MNTGTIKIDCYYCSGRGIMKWQSTTTAQVSYTSCPTCGGTGKVVVVLSNPMPKGSKSKEGGA